MREIVYVCPVKLCTASPNVFGNVLLKTFFQREPNNYPFGEGKITVTKNMKKIIVMSLSILALASCEKSELTPTNTAGNPQQKTGTITDSKYQVWHDNGVEWGCWDTGGNCAHTVPVVKFQQPIINSIFNTVYTNNASNIKLAFSNNKQVLLSYLPNDIIDRVISGQYTVKARGTDPNSLRYLLFSESNSSNLLIVYPIIFL